MNEPSYQQRIYRKLTDKFQPTVLDIKDDSARHAGHAGHHARGETHFLVKIVSQFFADKKPLERHRMVYEALSEELNERVHALNVEALSPHEYELHSTQQ